VDGDKTYIQIEGAVSSVVYRNAENGYAVLRLDTADGGVTAVGCLPDVFPGETLTLSGEWAAHHTYGEQFKAEFFTRGAPAGADAIYKYLASGVIRGIGPAKAKDIVDKFGAQALEVLETEPAKLSAIRGITARGARELGVAFRRTAGVRRLIESLVGVFDQAAYRDAAVQDAGRRRARHRAGEPVYPRGQAVRRGVLRGGRNGARIGL